MVRIAILHIFQYLCKDLVVLRVEEKVTEAKNLISNHYKY